MSTNVNSNIKSLKDVHLVKIEQTAHFPYYLLSSFIRWAEKSEVNSIFFDLGMCTKRLPQRLKNI